MENITNTLNTTKSQPCVSVVVTTYRRCNLLKRALRSLGRQTYPNIEIVIVDDNDDAGWNEKTKRVIEEEIKSIRFPVRYLKTETNTGVAAARNLGIDSAKGEYITFLDDDDVYLEEKVERQLEDMIRCNADYGITNLYLYNDEDKLVDKRIHSYITSTDQDSLLRFHLLYHLTGTDTFMFKADYINKIGGFPSINVGDEFYLMVRAINSDGRFCYSQHCYVKAYVHTGKSAGLSSGPGKIIGENNLYKEKKNYFNRLSRKEVRFIKVRHYAVLAYAKMRMKKPFGFFKNALTAFVISPAMAIGIINNHR